MKQYEKELNRLKFVWCVERKDTMQTNLVDTKTNDSCRLCSCRVRLITCQTQSSVDPKNKCSVSYAVWSNASSVYICLVFQCVTLYIFFSLKYKNSEMTLQNMNAKSETSSSPAIVHIEHCSACWDSDEILTEIVKDLVRNWSSHNLRLIFNKSNKPKFMLIII